MICTACKRAADLQREIRNGEITMAEAASHQDVLQKMHADCPGDTHCLCQHRVLLVATVPL